MTDTLRPKQRRFQFHLSTLMLLVAGCAVLFALPSHLHITWGIWLYPLVLLGTVLCFGERPTIWYLSILAAFYVYACGACSVRYVYNDVIPDGAHVPAIRQFLCFGLTLFAALYLLKPPIGHLGLIGVTLTTILFAALEREADAVVFHSAVLALLLIPLFTGRARLPFFT